MAWRNIRLYYLHAARVVGSANITSNVSFSTSKDFLVDDRGGMITRLATGTNNYIQLDRLSASTNINKLFIPAGHELGGCTIRLESDDNSGFASPTTMLAATAIPAGSAAINYDVTASGERYVRLTMETNGTWGLGELYLSQQRTLVRGPEPGWSDRYVYPAEIFAKRTGARPAAEFGTRLRSLEFSFRRIEPADFAFWAALESTVGITRPFLIDTPYDDGGTIWCSLLGAIERDIDSQNPAGEADRYYRQRVSLLEWAA